ncbi:deoxynucleoside kinase [Mesoplasma lactucae]|uniref:Deoxyguanosine kinase n=1 Tax=Mesoplasma lactucae ATCC 49193 TaxID=81460 RepID=A0A291IR61_9MOLU|nr:deoxynucleoside kinase [Mesoplasma lactucae]ATG97279.1 deoxyguanosine kinase [Mesoplasma lactucae ATCC 49193]ATZ20271.1 deoxyadenosine/deoxycytidine kinase [Mesoplasma lactucae ATCC 49193]MCL8216442.1 Deoxyadenosine/deoxycytidine kinase [Mesoplasma lactucae ATCC 49193]
MRIAIFGTVGAGKSTVSTEISKRLGYEIFPEPIDDNPYFDDYYKDLKGTVFKMQIYMLAARSKQLRQAVSLKNIIFDRTILEDPIFMQVNHDLGNVNDVDYQTYNDFYENVIMENLKLPDERVKFDVVIYLKLPTKKAEERIAKRGRPSEQIVDSEYWEILNKRYEDFYKKHQNDFNFAVIDAETDDFDKEMDQVMEAIYKTDPSLRKA